jgi:hypothetical protein
VFHGLGEGDKAGEGTGSDSDRRENPAGRFNTQQGSKAIHLVSAWATENRLVFAQIRTEEKSNEITAIPAVLEMMPSRGA